MPRHHAAPLPPIASLALALIPATAHAQGFSPAEAPGKMSVPDGLEVRLVASEPLIRQPVAIEFDDRGRLWAIQYLQYPNPSGLNRVEVDRYSRTTYDRIPEPPPRGPKGSDRITILEDTDGDGRADRAKDFATGLNLASGLAFGNGGVYVLQVPYLLFYPDRNRDDAPDGDPEVLLTGFGMEDAHSVANSLTWGPDGWLYGLQGSTVTAKIRGIEFQQGIWRYHPGDRRFELFAEGGGNMWGLDFNRRGDLITSTNAGGFVMLHAVQGGYYWKSFGKHGPLHNPYTFGYFDHVPHEGVRGGHVSVGGLFYEADAFPPEWRGRYIAADLLDHSIHWHEVVPDGSSYRARFGGDVLRANDTWFAPSDLTLGPDGSLYVTDWHDKRTAHPDPDADWDRSNGRIYAIRPKGGGKPTPPPDAAAFSSDELIKRLGHPNIWHARRARRILAERRDPAAIEQLRAIALGERTGAPRLEALWVLAGAGAADAAFAGKLLADEDPDLRPWAVRLIGDGDAAKLPREVAVMLAGRARIEPDVRVRAQLAGTAARLPAELGLEIASTLLRRDLDASDPQVPLRLWWAIERHATTDRDAILARFAAPDAWKSALIRDAIEPRLVRRFAAEKNAAGDAACARLLASAPGEPERLSLLAALDEATRGRQPGQMGPELTDTLRARLETGASDAATTRIAARANIPEALALAAARAADPGAADAERIAMIDLLGERGDRANLDALIKLAVEPGRDAVRAAALRALSPFDEGSIPAALLPRYAQEGEAWRRRARELLLGRAAWAKALLGEVDAGKIPASEIPLDEARKVAALGDPALDSLVRKHWGALSGATPEAKLAEVRRLNNDLRAGQGDLGRGQALFREHCATCHRLFDEGKSVGPDLTHANRLDREYLLVSLVDPAGVIRKEYRAAVVQTRDGRVLSGLIAEQTPDRVTLINANEERTTIPAGDIEEIAESSTSLMPEDLYRRLDPGAIRDLFRYLQSNPPAPTR